MILVKSLLVGLVAAVMAAILLLLGGMAAVAIIPHPEGTTIAFDPPSVVRSSRALWAFAIVTFALAFVWEYRRKKPPLTK